MAFGQAMLRVEGGREGSRGSLDMRAIAEVAKRTGEQGRGEQVSLL